MNQHTRNILDATVAIIVVTVCALALIGYGQYETDRDNHHHMTENK